MDMRHASTLTIDLGAVDHNMTVLRGIVGSACGICPIVKADAYGLGAQRLAKRLALAGASMLAVYTPAQAAELVRVAVGLPVLVMMPVYDIQRVDELYRALVCGRLHLSVHDDEHLTALVRIAERFGVTMNLHLEVDTGMSRGGCDAGSAGLILERIAGNRLLRLSGLMTHFSAAERDAAFTRRQLETFNALIAAAGPLIPRDCIIHAANTFATLRDSRCHQSMIRIGLAWAGYGSEWMDEGEFLERGLELRPSVSWVSRIVQVKAIAAGTPVGYGSTWRAAWPSRIGLVPVGYADGYPIGLGRGQGGGPMAQVAIVAGRPGAHESRGGRRLFAPVVGAINMDQITVDLTDLPASEPAGPGSIGVGTTVELISPDREAPNHLTRLAAAAGTIPHELLCHLNPRIPRVYASGHAVESEPALARSTAAG
jgi:alanine racemase